MALSHEQFADFFQAIHGDEPFEWQKDFAEQVLNGDGWPDVIRVPTGCGKTCVLDVALFELAMQSCRGPNERMAARRICFVIDRRLVVDEVTEHAVTLRKRITDADKPVLQEVAAALKQLAANESDPLRVVRLRGGVYRDDGWTADPLTPTILISTVDQIGSRLLFRGYGVSPRSRPVHAGLLAYDTRIILDEAHLSTVFAETLERIRQHEQWAEQSPLPDGRRVSVVSMSATAGEGQRMFALSDEQRKDSQLSPRLGAAKPAELVEVKVANIKKDDRFTPKGREQERKNRETFGTHLAAKAKSLAGFDADESSVPPRVIGVVVNRIATARQVFEQLAKVAEGEPERDVILLTGRIRPYDRDRLLKTWLPKIKAKRDVQPDKPLFVVATQTVEVGANIDFDALVTEAAPLDALRQRFGRLFRIPDKPEGRPGSGVAAILIRSDQKTKSDDDPVYGQAIAETWKWMMNGKKAKKGQPKTIDFGVNQLDPKVKKLTTEQLRKMIAPQPDAPLLFPAHLDAWVQTNPTPVPDPDVAPFLHGRSDAATDVQVVWRADLKEDQSKRWAGIVALMPPRTREAMPVPVYEARAWLRRQAEGDVADVEGVEPPSQRGAGNHTRKALRWCGPKGRRTKTVTSDEIRPGDTVVVPADYGGADQFGWNPERREPVTDIAETCLSQLIASYPANAFRRPKLRVRLHADLLPETDERMRERLKAFLNAAVSAASTEDGDPWPATLKLLNALSEHVDEAAHRAAIEAIRGSAKTPRVDRYPGGVGLVISGPLPIDLPAGQAAPEEEAEYEEPTDDEQSLIVDGRPIGLAQHTAAVTGTAVEFAEQLGLEEEYVESIRLAAQWHDEGKRDRRFQAWLHGSEIKALAALAAGHALAKSGRDPQKNDNHFGYPKGGRHEFVSVRILEAAGAANGEHADLVKLLIGTHHGYGRPWAPVLNDPNPIPVVLQTDRTQIEVCSDHCLYCLASGWVDLYWRMIRKHGWWGLAYLESLLVTADRLVSAEEQRRCLLAFREDCACVGEQQQVVYPTEEIVA